MGKKKINIKSVSTDVESGDVNISYKNVRIAGLSETTTAVLETKDTICEDDIEVEYTKPSGGNNGNSFNITNNSSRNIPLTQLKGGAIIDNRYYSGLECAANDSISYKVFNEYVLRNDDYEIQYRVDVIDDIITVTLNGTPISFNDGYLINISSSSEIVGNTYNIVISDKISD